MSTYQSFSANFKLAVVVDIILDDTHPYFNKNSNEKYAENLYKVNPSSIPLNYNNEIADINDIDYSYIGRAKVRRLDDDLHIKIDNLKWAIPIHNTITQYPLINETVLVIEIGNNLYYTNPFNLYNFIGGNFDLNLESTYSINSTSAIPASFKEALDNYRETGQLGDLDWFQNKQSYIAPPTDLTTYASGYLGESFIFNNLIRNLRHYEGDTVIESRFGQSIRFTAYNKTNIDSDRKNDTTVNAKNSEKVLREDSSYYLNDSVFPGSSNGGYGNPRIVIRNRQRNIAKDTDYQLHPKLPAIKKITDKEKNYGGQIEEDINNDGSTIEISSGLYESGWVTTCYKSMFGIQDNNSKLPTEEQPKYNPDNSTDFKFPSLIGDQIILNSDRILLSARFNEMLMFSKKRFGIVTDDEYTVDANSQIVLTTNGVTCVNSPQIFLGQYGETNEPAVLGQTLTDTLYDICTWLLEHVHWYNHVHPYPHTHPDAGGETPTNTINSDPNKTQIPVQQLKMMMIRDNLNKIMSRRVFITGGGYAPGANGVKPNNSNLECKDPVNIDVSSGNGVIGTFNGKNRREI